ncbi:MAG: hypothetical protein ACP5LD_00880 [Desulfomonilaceae bacterium]
MMTEAVAVATVAFRSRERGQCLANFGGMGCARNQLFVWAKHRSIGLQAQILRRRVEKFSKMIAKCAVVALYVIPTKVGIHDELPGCRIKSDMTEQAL